MSQWSRPACVPYRQVWHTFQAREPDHDQLVQYRVQDLPEERVEEAVSHMSRYFLPDEPQCASLRIHEDPVGLAEFGQVWRDIATHRVAVVCFREGCDEIVGLNMLDVTGREDKAMQPFQCDGLQRVCDAYDCMVKRENLFEKYGVDQYRCAWGLSVAPRFRGLKISTEILRARIPLCKAMGLKISVTLFSHRGSQVPAVKVGFRDEVVMSYEDLTKEGYEFPGLKYETAKLMTLVVE